MSRRHAGQVEVAEALDLERDDPQHDVEAAALAGDVDAEAALAGQLEREVALVEVEVLAEGIVLDQDADDLFRVLGREDLVAELDELAVKAVERQITHLEVDIARALLETQAEKPVQLFPFHQRSSLLRRNRTAGASSGSTGRGGRRRRAGLRARPCAWRGYRPREDGP